MAKSLTQLKARRAKAHKLFYKLTHDMDRLENARGRVSDEMDDIDDEIDALEETQIKDPLIAAAELVKKFVATHGKGMSVKAYDKAQQTLLQWAVAELLKNK